MFSSLKSTAALNKSIERFKLKNNLHGFVLVPIQGTKINILDPSFQMHLQFANTTISVFSAPKGYCWRYLPYDNNLIKAPFFVPFPFDFNRKDSLHANHVLSDYQIWSWSRIQYPIKKGEFLMLNEIFGPKVYSPCLSYIYLQHIQIIKDLSDEIVDFPNNSLIISEIMSLVNISLCNLKTMIKEKRKDNICYGKLLTFLRTSVNILQTIKHLRNTMHPIDFASTLVYVYENDFNFFCMIPGSNVLIDIMYFGSLQNNTVLWKRFQFCKIINGLDCDIDLCMVKNESCAKKLITFAETRLFKDISKLYTCNHMMYKMIQVEKSGPKQMLDSIIHCQKSIKDCKQKMVLLMNNIEKVKAEHIANAIAVRMLGEKVSIVDLNSTWSLNVFKTVSLLNMEENNFEAGFMQSDEICVH